MLIKFVEYYFAVHEKLFVDSFTLYNYRHGKMNIALTLSGGGYRAAAFHTGVLSYLNRIYTADNETLLENVRVLSTVSGGTIVGLRYMQGLACGESTADILKNIYRFMMDVDLVADALKELGESDMDKPTSLIRTMAGIYDKKLFHGAKMEKLLEYAKSGVVRHFSANATDFTNGLQFRFQATEGTKDESFEGSKYGLIGNGSISLNRNVAADIHLGDILACSSCFPGGFEPMVFPYDFNLSEELRKSLSDTDSFGIMDGGIVDNQGIESVLLAEERMKRRNREKDGRCIDLIITSDVSSPYMEAYSPTRKLVGGWIGRRNLESIIRYIFGGELLMTVLLILSFFFQSSLLQSIFGAVWLVLTSIWLVGLFLKSKIRKIISKTVVGGHTDTILKLSISDIGTLITNRTTSLIMLATTVFMKHIRRLNYDSIYEDDSWRNRRIMNAIYELRENESWEKKNLPEWMKPSEAMQENSRKAAAMGTTLWFTAKDKKNGIPQSLIATGQYTMCWNLLKHIEKSKQDSSNMSEQMLLFCKEAEEEMRADWEKFKDNPLWMVEEIA